MRELSSIEVEYMRRADRNMDRHSTTLAGVVKSLVRMIGFTIFVWGGGSNFQK